MKKSVTETLNFLQAQKATEIFGNGENVEYDIKSLNLLRYVGWRYKGY